jgi:protein-S-isoprenylcysteine O-methyltransferase Ste14
MPAVLAKLFMCVGLLWPASEVVLGVLTRAKGGPATVRDRGSLVLLWSAIIAGIAAGMWSRFSAVGRMGAPPTLFLSVGLALIVLGLALRWTAILTLGRFFTSNVAIQTGHAVVRTGVYRYVRHPSYSGMLVAFLGVGLGFGNWLSLLSVLVPIAAALLYRVHVEEHALTEALGRTYTDYCRTTKRLIPGVY